MQRCEVFLGSSIDDRNELRFLRRLRADLENRDCAARIYANFITRHNQRQVDFLVSTAHRLVHVELKTADPRLPLIGATNGPWGQLLPDGRRRSLDRNFYTQANSTTYAISDDMRDLARAGEVPQLASQYYTRIHTAICVLPNIPSGSDIAQHNHVDVVGYEQLLDLLCSDGPRPAWNDGHWSAFTRYLQLYTEPLDDQDASQRISQALVEDYRRRFAAARRRELRAFVPIAARHAGTLVTDPPSFLVKAVDRAQTVIVFGPSGAGKTHAAKHAAATAAESGGVPVWVRCSEYQRGHLSHTLSRAVAPFTTQACLPLLKSAIDLGLPTVIFLDGLNECAPTDREVLIEQLDALRLRWPTAIVITCTEPVKQSDADAIVLETAPPDDDARQALVEAYGHRHDTAGLEAFRTPMELSMAAECGETLRPGATSTELFDAYITRRCPAEKTRTALRRLATKMDTRLRGSLTIAEVRLHLHRAATSPSEILDIDHVLNSPLLTVSQGRAAFTHELLARFLTAEQLVIDAADSHTLAESLRDARRKDLHTHAVGLETDLTRRRDLLLDLARIDLLRAAVRGDFGADTAQAIKAEVDAVLGQAVTSLEEATLNPVQGGSEDQFNSYWTTGKPCSEIEQTMLRVAGETLIYGLFVDNVGALLDATDQRCAEQMRRLRTAGNRASISTVVSATYNSFFFTDNRENSQLAASIVTNASEHGWFRPKTPTLPSPARRLWEQPGQPRWGRLTAALHLMDPDNPEDQTLLPALFAAAWKANGYHLRLKALDVANRMAHKSEEPARGQMRMLLEDCDKSNVMLNSLLFEALAAYDGIEPLRTEEQIHAEITEVLSSPIDPQAWEAAKGLTGMIFEDQRLHGPYAEVLYSLDDADLVKLYVMAARSTRHAFNRDTTLQVIVDHLDHVREDIRDILQESILHIDWENPFRQEVIRAHLIAIHGWAKLFDQLPPAPNSDSDPISRAWRIIDELLFTSYRDEEIEKNAATALWREVQASCADAAIDVLANIRLTSGLYEINATGRTPYQRLLSTWPEELRQLLEWFVQNPRKPTERYDRRSVHESRTDLIEDLAHIGNASTVQLLENYLTDPKIAERAVNVIRMIRRRIERAEPGETSR